MNGLPPAPASPGAPRRAWLVPGLLLLLALAGAGVVLIPAFQASREKPRDEACAANMEVLARAIAEYNQDHPATPIDAMADAGNVFSPTSVLPQGQYLRHPLSKPLPSCDYLGTGLASGGRIHCPQHGTSEDVRKRIANHPVVVRFLRPLVRWLFGVR